MKNNSVKIDEARGYDVMRGKRVLKHFTEKSEAEAYASLQWGRYVRYWGIKEERKNVG